MIRFLILTILIFDAAQAQTRRVVAIAHRGEHLHHPENTMPAFEEAVHLGADFIEVDVRTTADGKLVLSHDANVDRCTNGNGEVAKMTFEEIRALDAGGKMGPEFKGTKVPTFDEVLNYARGKINIYVDVKQVAAKELVAHIVDHGMADHVVIYSGRLSKDIQQINPKLKIMPESVNIDLVQRIVSELHPKVIAFGASDWKPEIIKLAKDSGAELYVDRQGSDHGVPTDNPAGWQAAIDAGADGIQTDRPGELVSFLREKGYKEKR
uniref:Glycerophosphoryl diester phosphodiesterase n=1 Tax=Solibacter usitatus (strain Ellin6076) TaxID=234267 RepID=Q01R14_SOLUE